MSDLWARLASIDQKDQKVAIESFNRILARLSPFAPGLSIRVNNGDVTLAFPNVKTAIEFCSKFSTTFPDRGVMIGNEFDPLVVRYPLFRLNEAFWHLLLYVAEGKIQWDAGSERWLN